METGFDLLQESEVHYAEILMMPREIPSLETLWKASLPLPEAFSDLTLSLTSVALQLYLVLLVISLTLDTCHLL